MASVFCNICGNENQQKIETALLSGTSIDEVSQAFGVDLNALKIHAVMHLGSFSKAETMELEESTSIAQKLKLQEAVVLRNTYQEYYATLKKLGGHINKQISKAERDDLSLGRFLEKPTIDLYLGAGLQIRETIVALANIDTQLNSKKDGATNGILDLINAIRGPQNV